MVDRNVNVKITSKFLGAGVKQADSSFRNLQKTMQQSQKAGALFFKTQQSGVRLSTQAFQQMAGSMAIAGSTGVKAFKETKAAMTAVRKEFDFTFLTFLFAGMAMQKMATSVFKSLFKTYSMATDNQGKLNKDVLEMRSSWEFLKFSIISALDQSEMFARFKEGVIDVVDTLSDFFNTDPDRSILFLSLASAVGTAGVFFVTLGIIIQMVMAMDAFFGLGLAGSALASSMGIILAFVLVIPIHILAWIDAFDTVGVEFMNKIKDILNSFSRFATAGKLLIAGIFELDWNKVKNGFIAGAELIGSVFLDFFGLIIKWWDITLRTMSGMMAGQFVLSNILNFTGFENAAKTVKDFRLLDILPGRSPEDRFEEGSDLLKSDAVSRLQEYSNTIEGVSTVTDLNKESVMKLSEENVNLNETTGLVIDSEQQMIDNTAAIVGSFERKRQAAEDYRKELAKISNVGKNIGDLSRDELLNLEKGTRIKDDIIVSVPEPTPLP